RLPVARTAGRRDHAAFALAVVQRGDDDRAVDVVVEEAHQHFLADARQELGAEAAAGPALGDAYPAGGGSVVMPALPVETDADAALAVAVDFVGAVRRRAAVGADDDRGLAAECA